VTSNRAIVAHFIPGIGGDERAGQMRMSHAGLAIMAEKGAVSGDSSLRIVDIIELTTRIIGWWMSWAAINAYGNASDHPLHPHEVAGSRVPFNSDTTAPQHGVRGSGGDSSGAGDMSTPRK